MLFADATGDPDAPALIFLHGVGTTGWMWWRQVPAFGDRYCLAVDLPGHGRSNHVPWVSLADTTAQVAALIRARAAGGRAAVVGLSLGGYVGLELHDADVVERAIVSGVTAEPWPRRWLLGPQASLMSVALRSRRLVAAQVRRLGVPSEARADAVASVRSMRPGTYGVAAREVSLYRPSAVEVPTLVLAGSTEAEVIRRSLTRIPGATGRLVPGVGHGWNVEAPELFNATVRAWLDDTPLPAALQPG